MTADVGGEESRSQHGGRLASFRPEHDCFGEQPLAALEVARPVGGLGKLREQACSGGPVVGDELYGPVQQVPGSVMVDALERERAGGSQIARCPRRELGS